ncbi:hypothetical protein AHAS_Ahas19G0148600 [Arachis hypogaea]
MVHKEAIPEIAFKFEENAYPSIKEKFQKKRRWELLCNQPPFMSLTLVQEFYANAVRKSREEPPYKSHVRGVEVDFSPNSIRKVLKIRPRSFPKASYEERTKGDQRHEEILNDICILGAEWFLDSNGNPNQLKRGDFIPEEKGWLEIVRRSILPTSNNSEVILERAIMVHCIIKGIEVEVGKFIADNIQEMAKKNSSGSWIVFHGLPKTGG